MRYEHDTVLETLQPLTTEYMPHGYINNPPSSPSDFGVGSTALATDVTVNIYGTPTQVDVYSYSYYSGNDLQETVIAFEQDTNTFSAEVREELVADGAATSVASDYIPAEDGYTKVSGLFYTGEGNQADGDMLSITVTDENNNYLSTQSVGIQVTPVNDAPVITSSETHNPLENQTGVTTVTSMDDEGDAVTYTITGGDDGDKFDIDPTTGVLTFKAAPDFETPTDVGVDNVYDVEVTATDDGDPNKTDVQSIAVTVANTNEAPTATNMNADQTTAEDNVLDLTDIVVADPEGDNIMATLTLTNNAQGMLTTGATTTFGATTPTMANGVWMATGTVADVNDALAAVQFIPAPNFSGQVNISTYVTDNASQAIAGMKTVTITPVPDSPKVSDTIYLNTVPEDGYTLISQSELLDPNKVSDVDTTLQSLSVTDLQVATTDAGTIEDAYTDVVGDGVQAPADPSTINSGLTLVSADAAYVGASSQQIYALFEDAATSKFFVYSTYTDAAEVTTYMPGTEVEVSGDTWAFRPAQDFNGEVSFNYKITDGVSTPADATASIIVAPLPDDPVITAPETVVVTEDVAQFIGGISISDADVEDANEELSVTLVVTDGSLSVGHYQGSSVTLHGTLDEINGELAGAGRSYHEDYSFSGSLPTDTDADGIPDGGAEVIASVARTEEYQSISISVDGGTFYQQSFDPATETLNYAEVVYDTAAQAWTYVDGGSQLSNVAASDPDGPVFHEYDQTISYDVNISHDAAGQYWAYEANTGTYRALELDDLAVYEKTVTGVDGAYTVRYEHDTVLETLQPLTTEYMPHGYINNPPSSPSDFGVGSTALATDVTVNIYGTPTQVDVYSYSYYSGNDLQETVIAFEQDTNTFSAEVREELVADGAATSVASDYIPAEDGYTKVSGLFYTGEGNQADGDMLSITVTDENNNYLSTQSVGIQVTPVNDAPVITSSETHNPLENQTGVTTVTSMDDEGDAVTYTITGGDDGDKFDIDPTTGVLTFKAAPDFETPTDVGVDNVYDVEVTATDDGDPNKTDVQSIAVTVANTNEAPTATNMNADQTTAEDNVLDLTDIVVADPEGDNIMATLTLTNNAQGMLTTGATTTFGATTPTMANGVWMATGTVADVNDALAAVQFIPAPNFSGQVNISTYVTDNASQAIAGMKTVTITPVPDSPKVSDTIYLNTVPEDGYTLISQSELLDPNKVSDVDTTLPVSLGYGLTGCDDRRRHD